MAERIEGLSIGLSLDTLEMERGLTGLKDRLKTVNAEMRNNMSAFDRSETSVKKYETRLEGLNKKLEVQERVTQKSREEYERLAEEHGEGSKQAEKAKREYEKQSAALNNLSRYVDGATKDFEEFRREQARQETSLYKTGKALEKTGDRLTGIGTGMKNVGRNLTQRVTAPIVAAGALVLKTADEFDQAYNTIRTGTGATGADLEDLEESFRSVFSTVPNGADEVSTALADLNTLTGLTGTELEDLTVQFLELGKVTGEDVPTLIKAGSRVWGDWGIEVEDQADNLDYFFKVSQSTGVEVSKLMSQVVQFGAPMRQLGFDLDTTTVLLGAFEKEGVNTELVMGSMRQALGRMAREGIDAEEGLRQTMEAIKGAGSASEANAAAIELFGARAGPDMAAAIREGRFEIDDLVDAIAGSEETISGATEETRTLGERFGILKNEAMVALEPLGETLLELANDFIPVLSDKVGRLTNWFAGLSTESLETGIKIAGIAAAIGPLLAVGSSLISVAGGMATGLGKVMTWGSKLIGVLGAKAGVAAGAKVTLFSALKGLAAFMTGPWGLAIAALVGGGALAYNYFKDDAIPVVGEFGDQVSETTADSIREFEELHTKTKTELDLLFAEGGAITEEGKDTIVGAFSDMYNLINEKQDEEFAENTETLKGFFLETGGIMDKEEGAILAKMSSNYDKRQARLQGYTDRAEEIVQTAYEEERELTEAEEKELNTIRANMQAEAIKTLSASEEEQKVIMETMRREKGAIDARAAADLVKRSKETKDQIVADAEEQYEETIAAIIYERDTTGSISKEKADELIRQAERQRDETVTHAENQHNDIVEQAQKQANEHVNLVDWETGEVLSKWDVFVRDVDTLEAKLAQGFRDTMSEIGGILRRGGTDMYNGMASSMNSVIRAATSGLNGLNKAVNWVADKLGISFRISMLDPYQIPLLSSSSYSRGGGGLSRGQNRMYAKGTDFHPGGPAIVGDGGEPELLLYPNGHVALSPDRDTLLDMPRGTTVISGPETKKMMHDWDVPQYATGIGSIWNWAKNIAASGVNKLKDVGANIWDWAVKGGKTLLSNVLSRMGITSPAVNGGLGELVKGGFNKIRSGAYSKVDKLIPDLVPGGIAFGGMRRTSGFGPRRSPGGIGSTYHRGVDYAAPLGSIIRSQSGGRVVDNGYNRIRGNYVRIKQGAYDYMYQHNLANLVGRGASVKRGQAIARLGSTGASTGPHLHFEIWKNGVPINPEPFIKGGFETGGIVNDAGLYNLAEGGHSEFVIPTDPARRTDAMKLLALASKQIQGRNKRPSDIPAHNSSPGTLEQLLQATVEQNEILKAILAKDPRLNVSRETLTDAVEEQLAFNETGGYF